MFDLDTQEVTPVRVPGDALAIKYLPDVYFGAQVAMSPDGRQLYVKANGKLVALDTTTNRVARKIDSPINYRDTMMVLSPTGRYLYTLESYRAEIKVIDLYSGDVVAERSGGPRPTGGQFAPDGRRFYVRSETNVAIYDTDGFA